MKKKIKVYIGASKGISFTSRIIKWYQWGEPHTHIFYIVGNPIVKNPLVIESFEKPLFKGGVRKGRFFDLHTEGTEYDVYSVLVTYEQKEKIEEFLEDKIGHKYDYLGILGFEFRSKNMQSKKRYFCSELVFSAFQHAGINLLANTFPSQVSPALFIKSPLLKTEKLSDPI